MLRIFTNENEFNCHNVVAEEVREERFYWQFLIMNFDRDATCWIY
jgi:hypothetical protein